MQHLISSLPRCTVCGPRHTFRASFRPQRGGAIVGFILGLLAGLGVALLAVVLIGQSPPPLVQRDVSSASSAQIAEAERTRSWNPNAGLAIHPPPPANAQVAVSARTDIPAAALALPGTDAAQATAPTVDMTADQPQTAASAVVVPMQSAPAGPHYFVQAGAYHSRADADAQRAQIAMMGWEARISEREQFGRMLYRVRIGPFAKRADVDLFQQQLQEQGIATTIIRTQP